MRTRLLELLACPLDYSHPLDYSAEEDGAEGLLACSRCGTTYPVREGIPRFVILEGEGAELKQREIVARDAEYVAEDSHSLKWSSWPEFDAFGAALGDCTGLTVLDAGCGAGRITAAVRGRCRLVGVDYSAGGLESFRFPAEAEVDLLQGDVCRLPLRDSSFDVAFSSQVLEHVPTPRLRAMFIAELARTLKPGGRLVLTVYHWDRERRQAGVPKEGFHSSGIFYHCYELDELCRELSPHVAIERVWAVDTRFPKTYRLRRRLGSYNRYWSRIWRGRRLALPYSRLLMAIGRSWS